MVAVVVEAVVVAVVAVVALLALYDIWDHIQVVVITNSIHFHPHCRCWAWWALLGFKLYDIWDSLVWPWQALAILVLPLRLQLACKLT